MFDIKNFNFKSTLKKLLPSPKPLIKSYAIGFLIDPIVKKDSCLKSKNDSGLKFMKLNAAHQILNNSLNCFEENLENKNYKNENRLKIVRNYYTSGFLVGATFNDKNSLMDRIKNGASYSLLSVFSGIGFTESFDK